MSREIQQASPEALNKAIDVLSSGGVVAFPTETVYGLGADATSDKAVERVYQVKGRPAHNPLIVHLSDRETALKISILNNISQTLIASFWPGALTIIVELSDAGRALISSKVTAGLSTVGLRMPAHPIARDLISRFGRPIAAPSANRSGATSPTSAEHVARSFADNPDDETPDLILAGGSAQVGLESTIIDCTANPPVILREGVILKEHIEAALDISVEYKSAAFDVEPERVTSPGQLAKHYAPNTPIRLNAVDVKKGEALLAFGPVKFMASEEYGGAKEMPDHLYRNLSAEADLTQAAHNLYRHIHSLDQSGADRIAVMAIPNEGLGRAINDRLSRAAEKEGES